MTLNAAIEANLVEFSHEDVLDTWYEPVNDVNVMHPGGYDVMYPVQAICYTVDPEGDYVMIYLEDRDDELTVDPCNVHLIAA